MSGYTRPDGRLNVFIGYESGREAGGEANVFVGTHSGYKTQGDQNAFVGTNAGRDNTAGSRNLFVGQSAGVSNLTGKENVYLGAFAGASNTDGSGNIFLGHRAGSSERGSNRFIVSNTGSGALLYGDFTSNNLAVGVSISSSYRLYIAGDAYATGLWLSSDRKWKKNENKISEALAKVDQLQPKAYEYNDRQTYDHLAFGRGTHYGFIAQELKEVMPELVKEDTDGTLAVNYIGIIPLLTQAIQELNNRQQQIGAYEKRIDELEVQIDQLRQLVTGTAAEPEVDQSHPSSAEPAVIQAFPNPSSGSTTIIYRADNQAKQVLLKVTDVHGRSYGDIRNLATGASSVTLTPLGLSAGTYIVTLVQDGIAVSSVRVVIE